MATATTKTKTKATQTKTQAQKTANQAKQTTAAAKTTAEQAQRTVKTLVTDSAYATLGITDRAAAFVRNLNEVRVEAPEKLDELRRQAPGYVRTVREQARTQFDELAELGRQRAQSVRRTQKTREARGQVDTARSQMKAAATSLGRAVGANVEAAAKIVEKAGTAVNSRRQPQRATQAGDQRPYEERTVEELRDRAAELGIEGRSQMSKDELVKALRNAS